MNTKPLSIITQNAEMRRLMKTIDVVADSQSSILLIGETGVGKEIFAEYVHRVSNRHTRPFVKIGLAALPAELMASELFGYEKGSFTSANTNKKGLFEVAHTGSIFLDDIDDVPLDIQTKLLRVLESRELMHVGGTQTIPIDIRVIAASKVDLKTMVAQNKFRSDLFYRINVVPIKIPPLRERVEDIPLLVEHFLKKFAPDKKLNINAEVIQAMAMYEWPGNVRELRNVVQRMALFAEDTIEMENLPKEISGATMFEQISTACSLCFHRKKMPYKDIMRCLESKLFDEALTKAKGSQSEAAKILGLSLSTFRDKLKKNEDFQKKGLCNA